MDAERIVIVAYRPLPGKISELVALVKNHVNILKTEGLVTEREPVIMQATDGTVIEVFEWRSKDAIDKAHSNAAVQKLWEEFGNVCEYIPVGDVEEAKTVFSEFKPVN